MSRNLFVIFRYRDSELTLPLVITIPVSPRGADAQFPVVPPQNFAVQNLYDITFLAFFLQTDGEVISVVRQSCFKTTDEH